jgi:hypothetical protein
MHWHPNRYSGCGSAIGLFPILLGKITTNLSHKHFLSGIKGVITNENLLVVEYLNQYFGVPHDTWA